jgi:Family of unknown function (DUF5996)
MAYSHEVSSCGFWPGGNGEGSFYAYAYPQPDGFPDWHVEGAAELAGWERTSLEFTPPAEHS